jgi:hypothetical protein
MKTFLQRYLRKSWGVAFAVLAVASFSACSAQTPTGPPTMDSTQIFQSALLTATYAVVIPSQTPEPTITSTPAPTLTPTETPWVGPPPVLPDNFTTSYLTAGVTGHTYIEDTCEYLKMRWDPNNSAPGTVVMPVMFHSITKDYNEVAEDGSQIRHEDMVIMLDHAKELGFTTITTEQLVNFLETNARIPSRSMILIVDDRRPGVVREHFWPYLEENNWTLTLGWLIGDTDSKPASYLNCCPEENFSSLWEQMETYYASGYLDVQSHGYIHNINITQDSTDEFIRHEMVDSRQVLAEHFYCKDPQTHLPIPDCQTVQPLAFIWPGGGFTEHAAQIARESGYHVGFTTNPRGPVMFNWVPLADAADPAMPSWLAEGSVGDPMMVLPRYWSLDAAYRLDDVANIGEEAMNAAAQTRQAELDYYNYYCRDISGEIPTLTP